MRLGSVTVVCYGGCRYFLTGEDLYGQCNIQDYSGQELAIEQIFLNLTKRQELEDDAGLKMHGSLMVTFVKLQTELVYARIL